MTYNMGHYDYGDGLGIPDNIYADKVANYKSFFNSCGCDIIGLQEWYQYLDKHQLVNSNTELFNRYFPYNGGNTDIWCALKGKTLLYDLTSGNINGRPYIGCKVMSKKGPIQLLSVHFTPGDGAARVQDRIDEANAVIAMVSGSPRYIIFGDFNPRAGEEDALYSIFTNAGMNIANCGAFGKFSTWHNDTNYIYDNIITSANISITNVYMPNVYNDLSSDHQPLIAELHLD